MNKIINKYLMIGLGGVVMIATLLFFFNFQRNHFNNYLKPDSITTLYFYSSKCKDCKSIEGEILKERIQNKNMKLINVSSPANKKYIDKYGLLAVPTLIYVNPDGTYKKIYIGKQDVLKHIKSND